MGIKCWHCGTAVEDPPGGKLPFRAICEACSSWLHCCRNCKNYKPGLPNDCAIPGTEQIADREACNFCDEFQLLGAGPTRTADSSDVARRLFGDSDHEQKSAPPKDNFDDLFKPKKRKKVERQRHFFASLRFITLLTLVSLFVIPTSQVFGGTQGTIIIINGTSCSGKSTLACQLERDLSTHYIIIKKIPIVKIIKNDFIERITGKRPQNRTERTKACLALSHSQRRGYSNICRKAKWQSIQKVKSLADQGENVIFDGGMKSPKYLREFEKHRVIFVLVYAPLPVLINRAKRRQPNRLIKPCSKKSILAGYQRLYQPAEPDIENFIDTVNSQEIKGLFDVSNNAGVLSKCGLDTEKRVKIVPKIEHDIIINSDQLTIDESVQAVKAILIKKGYAVAAYKRFPVTG